LWSDDRHSIEFTETEKFKLNFGAIFFQNKFEIKSFLKNDLNLNHFTTLVAAIFAQATSKRSPQQKIFKKKSFTRAGGQSGPGPRCAHRFSACCLLLVAFSDFSGAPVLIPLS